ncbi:DUF5683 domain-containing protein [Sphingobacterium corticis]|uniref:DUF5683 domain-containing protein n=1 Tax=Sphingobacterium corticis TaxID=1812823 RepID=A0ABW5NP34_9SPHI
MILDVYWNCLTGNRMRYLGILAVILLCCQSANAQQDSIIRRTDSLANTVLADSVLVADSIKTKETRAERRARTKEEKERDKYYFKGIKKDSARLEIERISRVAWRRSLFVPGWGQYTNGGLWWIKVPVIYGGFVGGYLVFDYWQYFYREYQTELQFRFNNNGDVSDGPLGDSRINEQALIRQRDFARRNRDITILVTLGWYGLNVVEAYVDSMLSNRWNISDDLSFKVTPTIIPTFASARSITSYGGVSSMFTPGLKLTFNLN